MDCREARGRTGIHSAVNHRPLAELIRSYPNLLHSRFLLLCFKASGASKRVDNLGAYNNTVGDGLLIPSDCISLSTFNDLGS
jgi:hypothetical protein